MNFLDYLKFSAEEINRELIDFLNHWLEQSAQVNPKLTAFNQMFIDSCQGGKRLRGTLVKLGYELAGGKATDEIIKPALALEIFQTAILAHDDVFDQSPLRRGKPTLYRALGGDHYGMSQAVCLGDISFFLATKIISETNFQNDLCNKAVSLFSEMVINTGWGEMLDIALPNLKEAKKEIDVMTIQKLKTADYTVTYPLSLGATLAGASDELLQPLRLVGENLGIAFQIQDDILGVFGDEKTLGKSVTSDVEEGKNTLLIVEALQNADGNQKEYLEKYYGKGEIGKENLEEIKRIFIETGALEYSRKKAADFVEAAKKEIIKMPAEKEYKEMLIQMADFLVERQR
jgi:geranylgeranyl diphosphate synthase, type I